jgi:hypothetical protein
MNNVSNIKRAVSLYSYQEEFFLKKMNLDDNGVVTVATDSEYVCQF